MSPSVSLLGILAVVIVGASPVRALTRQELTDEERSETIDQIIKLLPTMTKEQRKEAGAHIANLVPGFHYEMVFKILLDPKAPAEVLEELWADLFTREDSVKLPALLKIAKVKDHPLREDAAAALEIFLDADFKEDWQKWEGALQAYLAEQKQVDKKPRLRPPGSPPPAK